MCKLFLQFQIEKNAVSAKGFTPLHHAVINGQTEVCKVLLEHDVDKNPRFYISSFQY